MRPSTTVSNLGASNATNQCRDSGDALFRRLGACNDPDGGQPAARSRGHGSAHLRSPFAALCRSLQLSPRPLLGRCREQLEEVPAAEPPLAAHSHLGMLGHTRQWGSWADLSGRCAKFRKRQLPSRILSRSLLGFTTTTACRTTYLQVKKPANAMQPSTRATDSWRWRLDFSLVLASTEYVSDSKR